MGKTVATDIPLEDYEHLEQVCRAAGTTIYAFLKDAITEKMRVLNAKTPGEVSAVVQEMIEALTERKRYVYQLGPYSDDNHRDWLAGRFPQATKREVIEAVAQWRKAGGRT